MSNHYTCGGLKSYAKRSIQKITYKSEELKGIAVFGGKISQKSLASLHKTPNYRKVKIYSAYLGEVEADVYDFGNGMVSLQTAVKGMDGQPDIFVKEVDVQLNKLYPDKYQYDIRYLAQLPASQISVSECKRHHDIIKQLEEKKDANTLSASEQRQLHSSYIHNNVVDIHFNTCQYVEFLHKKLKMNNVINTNILLSMHNTPRLDNAFFTGEYMVYGNGDRMFYPLGTSDIGGHELGHGLVQSAAGLKYQGHSGALNESFADVLGVCFEFFLYNKYNNNCNPDDDLDDETDWTIGEDSGKTIKFLRNMKDPTDAEHPQPKEYKGTYWADPNSQSDNGGVHTNSGVGNYCFYKLSKSIGRTRALRTFFRCLNELGPDASYIEFRDTLKKVTIPKFKSNITEVLNECGLTESVVTDWRP